MRRFIRIVKHVQTKVTRLLFCFTQSVCFTYVFVNICTCLTSVILLHLNIYRILFTFFTNFCNDLRPYFVCSICRTTPHYFFIYSYSAVALVLNNYSQYSNTIISVVVYVKTSYIYKHHRECNQYIAYSIRTNKTKCMQSKEVLKLRLYIHSVLSPSLFWKYLLKENKQSCGWSPQSRVGYTDCTMISEEY